MVTIIHKWVQVNVTVVKSVQFVFHVDHVLEKLFNMMPRELVHDYPGLSLNFLNAVGDADNVSNLAFDPSPNKLDRVEIGVIGRASCLFDRAGMIVSKFRFTLRNGRNHPYMSYKVMPEDNPSLDPGSITFKLNQLFGELTNFDDFGFIRRRI
ncbi:hypothetical protein L596_005677 [Steinernema carpocapsae]|uniref:Uncharacterized protein n=1 Tax=Steinernema carpocapsae TaxID=34508 RepID=A0A4U8UZX3_STECR|nr:hypothetical protein L596_005677 [Steinernema carpocapsae]